MTALDVQLDVAVIKKDVEELKSADADKCKKLDKIYQILVTGNGEIPLIEQVRKHEAWIQEQKEDIKAKLKTRRDIQMMIYGQIIIMIFVIISMILGLK